MDLDTAYIESLIYDWVEQLQQTMKKLEQSINNETDFVIPFIAIPESTISAIFNIANYLRIDQNVKYMTLYLYDKFICEYFWKNYKAEIINGPSEESWNEICEMICNRSKLYLLSCFQLACKMDSHSSSLGISQILNLLYIIDKKSEYTRNMIISSEYEVFKTVRFHMPFCTPLHCVEILLAVTGLRETPDTYKISLSLLDLALLQHEKLYLRLQNETQRYVATMELTRRKLILLKSNVFFLGAAIVVCTTFFLSLDTDVSKFVAAKLAELSNMTDIDIWKMANILLITAIQE